MVQTTGQITGLLSANSTCAFSLFDDHKARRKSDVSKLKQDSKRQAFVNDLCSRLDALEHISEDVDESWTVFRDTIHSSAMDVLGPISRKHQDWFDENDKEIQGLLEEKHQKHKAYLRNTSSVSSKTANSNICKTVQTRLRDMQDSWLRKKADEIQSFADRKDMKKFFDALKTVYGPQSSGTTPLLSADGTSLLTDKEAILKRWAEHFDGVLNQPSSINDEAINKASAAFSRLRGSIWDRSGIRLDTKLKVYRSVVLPTLLYACETWTVYQWHAKRLNHFHTSCLRKLLKIKWQDRIPDTEVLKRAGMQSIHTLPKLAQLRWTGHITRMPDERLPKKIL